MRREFYDNKTAADLLGNLMVQAMDKRQPLKLVTLGVETVMPPESAVLVNRMTKRAKPMLI